MAIDAILFGGRRATNVPLVNEARDWEHGVFIGATVSPEVVTAAGVGGLGQLRRGDVLAMLPFCSYNMAEGRWLKVGAATAPDAQLVRGHRRQLGRASGENSRVLAWIIDRVTGVGAGVETPISRTVPVPRRSVPRSSCSRAALVRHYGLSECVGDAVPPSWSCASTWTPRPDRTTTTARRHTRCGAVARARRPKTLREGPDLPVERGGSALAGGFAGEVGGVGDGPLWN